jgi:hypothetical protein
MRLLPIGASGVWAASEQAALKITATSTAQRKCVTETLFTEASSPFCGISLHGTALTRRLDPRRWPPEHATLYGDKRFKEIFRLFSMRERKVE